MGHQNQEERKKSGWRRTHARWIPGGMSTHPVRSVAHYGVLTTDADLSAYWFISHHMHAPNVTHTNEQTCKYVCVLRDAIICRDETTFSPPRSTNQETWHEPQGGPSLYPTAASPGREFLSPECMRCEQDHQYVRTIPTAHMRVCLAYGVRQVRSNDQPYDDEHIYIAAYGFCPVQQCIVSSISWVCLIQLFFFLMSFYKDLTIGRIWLQRKIKYHRDYVQRRIKEFIGFRIQKVMVYYYLKDSADYVFTLILDSFH